MPITHGVTSHTQAWLYVRGNTSVRIVVDGTSVRVYGPGSEFNHSEFAEQLDTVLHHAALEDALVRAGFTLEGLTTERRAGTERRRRARGGADRRRPFRLVRADGVAITTGD